MTLYHSPGVEAQRPSLVGDLLSIAAKDTNHQLENQATTVLAWLVDRSPSIASAVLRMFLGTSAPSGGLIGARTQVAMPKPQGGALYPDLSICMADHELQLLVDVKVGASFHPHEDFGGELQPDVYRHLWRELGSEGTAIRAVGTLTRSGAENEHPDPNQLIARDVTWRELRDELQMLLQNGSVEPECHLVAESFVRAIDERLAPAPPSEDALQKVFAAYGRVLDAVKNEINQRIQGVGAAKAIAAKAVLGWRIPLPSANGMPLFLRIYISPANTRMNAPGQPDALIAAPERDTNGALQPSDAGMVEAAGFAKTKVIDGYTLYAHSWPSALATCRPRTSPRNSCRCSTRRTCSASVACEAAIRTTALLARSRRSSRSAWRLSGRAGSVDLRPFASGFVA